MDSGLRLSSLGDSFLSTDILSDMSFPDRPAMRAGVARPFWQSNSLFFVRLSLTHTRYVRTCHLFGCQQLSYSGLPNGLCNPFTTMGVCRCAGHRQQQRQRRRWCDGRLSTLQPPRKNSPASGRWWTARSLTAYWIGRLESCEVIGCTRTTPENIRRRDNDDNTSRGTRCGLGDLDLKCQGIGTNQ